MYQAISSRSAKLGKNCIVRAALDSPSTALPLWRHADAQLLHHGQVEQQEKRGDPGQHRDVKAEKSRQGRAGYFLAATQEDHDRIADHGNLPGDFRSDLGCEEGERIPGQEISAESETHH